MLFSPCFLTSLHLEERSITTKCKMFEHQGDLIVSVDFKKKERIGQFKNNGREWMPEGQTTPANVYDSRARPIMVSGTTPSTHRAHPFELVKLMMEAP